MNPVLLLPELYIYTCEIENQPLVKTRLVLCRFTFAGTFQRVGLIGEGMFCLLNHIHRMKQAGKVESTYGPGSNPRLGWLFSHCPFTATLPDTHLSCRHQLATDASGKVLQPMASHDRKRTPSSPSWKRSTKIAWRFVLSSRACAAGPGSVESRSRPIVNQGLNLSHLSVRPENRCYRVLLLGCPDLLDSSGFLILSDEQTP